LDVLSVRTQVIVIVMERGLREVMTFSTKEIFGRRALHNIFAEDYIHWAVEMLVHGHDSPNLRILAGLDRRDSVVEVEKYFLHAATELDIDQVEGKAAMRAYACEIAERIIEGKFTSHRDAIRVLYQIWLDSDHDREYTVWQELDDALDSLLTSDFPYTYPSATLENFDQTLRHEAARFIDRLAKC
jgi:hypothetical protein